MIQSTPFAERVKKAFLPTPHGVVGLVDKLLGLCRAHQLRFRFADGHCSVQRLGADETDALNVALPKSVFRAMLARVASLCNEQRPGSVTPYHGNGEVVVPPPLSSDNTPPSMCFVSFTNTPSEQRLEMRFSRSTAGAGKRFTVQLRDKRTVTVFGDACQYIQHHSFSTPNDYGSYGILSHCDGREVLVALFRVSEVIGVFSGETHEPGEIETSRDTQRQKALEDSGQGI